jgi:hypothetical protein
MALLEVQQEALQPVAAGGGRRRDGEGAQRVEHQQLRIVPGGDQAQDPVLLAEIEAPAAGAIVGEDREAVGRRPEQGKAIAQLGGAHLAVDIEHAARAGAAPAEEAAPVAALGDRPGDAEGQEALADAGRSVDQRRRCRRRARAAGDRGAAGGRPPSVGRR